MRETIALLWWHLGILTKRRYDALCEQFGTLDDATSQLDSDLLRQIGVRADILEDVIERLRMFDQAVVQQHMLSRSVQLVSIEDNAYPDLLRQIPDAPVFLSFIGDISILRKPCVAVVGTRGMSAYGKRVTEKFSAAFARSGISTVSGLAFGVDAAVARSTMKHGGYTVAVLGHGLGAIYPQEHTDLAKSIVKHGGVLLSEFSLTKQPERHTFPARNRIIAGLCTGTVVCEAPEKSGAVITAELALEYGRDVFAVPSSIFDPQYAGCHRLIASGCAQLVSHPDDALRSMGMIVQEEARSLFQPATPDQDRVYTSLTPLSQSTDDLVRVTGLSIARVAAALTHMELLGACKNMGGSQWVRL